MAITATGGWGLAATAAYPVVALATNAIVGSQIDPLSAGVLGLEAILASEATTRWFNNLRPTEEHMIDWCINAAVQCFLCHYIAEYFSNSIGLCPIEFGQTSYLALVALIGLILFFFLRPLVAPLLASLFAGPRDGEDIMIHARSMQGQSFDDSSDGDGGDLRAQREPRGGHGHSHGPGSHGANQGPGTPEYDDNFSESGSTAGKHNGTPDSRQQYRARGQPFPQDDDDGVDSHMAEAMRRMNDMAKGGGGVAYSSSASGFSGSAAPGPSSSGKRPPIQRAPSGLGGQSDNESNDIFGNNFWEVSTSGNASGFRDGAAGSSSSVSPSHPVPGPHANSSGSRARHQPPLQSDLFAGINVDDFSGPDAGGSFSNGADDYFLSQSGSASGFSGPGVAVSSSSRSRGPLAGAPGSLGGQIDLASFRPLSGSESRSGSGFGVAGSSSSSGKKPTAGNLHSSSSSVDDYAK